MIIVAGSSALGFPATVTRRWNGTRWAEVSPERSPGARCFHAAAPDPSASAAWVTGGCRATDCSSRATGTWRWQDAGWSRVGSGQSEPPSDEGTLVAGPDPGTALFIGGSILDDTLNDEGYLLGPGGWRFASPGLARQAMSGVFFDDLGQAVLFGGFDSGGTNNLLWSWDGRAAPQPLNAQGTGPSRRARAGVVFEPARSAVLMHGGQTTGPGGLQTLDDTWRLESDGSGGLQWTMVADGFTSASSVLLHDPVHDRTFSYSGVDGMFANPSIHELVDGQWREVVIDGAVPRGRVGHVGFYDADLESFVIHGGATAADPVMTVSCLSDTWLLPVPSGARPGLVAAFRFDSAEVDRRDVSGLSVRGRIGGLGYSRVVPGPGEALAGARIEGWSHSISGWVSIAETRPTSMGRLCLKVPLSACRRGIWSVLTVEFTFGWYRGPATVVGARGPE